MLKYRYNVKSWKSKVDVVKASLENEEDLTEGVWSTYSDVVTNLLVLDVEVMEFSIIPPTKLIA